ILHTPTPPGQVLTSQLPPGTHLPQMPRQRRQERLSRHIAQPIPALPVIAVEGRTRGHDRAHHYPTPFPGCLGTDTTLISRDGGLLCPTDTTILSRDPDNRQHSQQLWINHDEPRGNNARKHWNARP